MWEKKLAELDLKRMRPETKSPEVGIKKQKDNDSDSDAITSDTSIEGIAAQLVALGEMSTSTSVAAPDIDQYETILCSGSNSNNSSTEEVKDPKPAPSLKHIKNATINKRRRKPFVTAIKGQKKVTKMGLFKVKVVHDENFLVIPPDKKRIVEYRFE